MTGRLVKIVRDGREQSVEFDELTDEELIAFAGYHPEDGWEWAKFLAKWIRDNVQHRIYYGGKG